MDRRDFLKGSAGAALLSGAGCSPGAQSLPPATQPLPEMEALLGKLDRDLARIDQQDVSRHFARLAPPALLDLELAPQEKLLRGSVKALYLSGAFRELPEEAQLHPGVQARLWKAAPELDAAMLGMRAHLEAISDAELCQVRDALRADPELLPNVVECLDAASAEGEIQPERRLKLRSLMKTLGWRLQHQSPRAIIDEYVDKMRRVETRDGSLAAQQRRLAARMSEEAFLQYRERIERIAVRWQEQGAGAGSGGDDAGPSSTGVNVGLGMMGFGAVAFGVGSVLIGAGSGDAIDNPLGRAGLVVTTLGGLTVIIGLLVTFVSAVARSNERARWMLAGEAKDRSEQPHLPPLARRSFLVDERWAVAWVERNRSQLPQDLAAGRGPLITELAQATGLSPANHERLGTRLREHRAELLGLVEGAPLTGPRAVEFFNVVGDVLAGDPVLAAEFNAAMVRLKKP